jgi:hypothetical protein
MSQKHALTDHSFVYISFKKNEEYIIGLELFNSLRARVCAHNAPGHMRAHENGYRWLRGAIFTEKKLHLGKMHQSQNAMNQSHNLERERRNAIGTDKRWIHISCWGTG